MNVCDWILTEQCHAVVDYFTDPFWWWLFWGGAVAAGAIVLGWLFPALRSVTAAVVVAVAVGLTAYRKGGNDARLRWRQIIHLASLLTDL